VTRRVLAVRLDSLGDVLLAGPAVRAIAASAEVHLLCGPQGASAAALLPGARLVSIWPAPWVGEDGPAVSTPLVEQLQHLVRAWAPDEAVIFTSFHQSPLPLALLLRLAGVPRITGASVDHAGRLLDVRLCPGEDFPEDQPEAERALAIAAAAGFELPAADDGALRIRAADDVSALVGPGPYVVVHPGTDAPARAWPAAHFAAAVRLLVEAGIRVVVTGGPDEVELTAAVAQNVALDLGGRTDLSVLAGVLRGASALIAGNTGPAHVAAAVGTPVVSLFAPVVPAVRWAPYRVPVVLLGRQDAACRNTRSRVCPVPGHPCLTEVSPAEVVSACQSLLARPDRQGATQLQTAVPA
jgi:ADP-heptose:LPS heptosyltransferase